MPPRFIARQLSRPSGWFAPVIGFLMKRTNQQLNHFALEHLAAGPQDRVLEVGFGSMTMPKLVTTAAFVTGVDRSADVIGAARAKYAKAIRAGRADFREGVIEHLPLGDASCTKALTVNTIYFWKSLEAGFTELARVLEQRGRLVVGFAPKSWMETQDFPANIFTPRTPGEVTDALRAAGFVDVQIKSANAGSTRLVALATKG